MSIRTYITSLAGKHLGFDEQIRKLEVRIMNLEDDKKVMHENYMEKYRELEKPVANFIENMRDPQFPMNLHHFLCQTRQFEYESYSPRLIIATGESHVSLEPRQQIALAHYSMGMALDYDKRAITPEIIHACAVGFARKASNMAYDLVMEKFGHRPEKKV